MQATTKNHLMQEAAAKWGTVFRIEDGSNEHECFILLQRSAFLIDGGQWMVIRATSEPSGAVAFFHNTRHEPDGEKAVAMFEDRAKRYQAAARYNAEKVS